jgi:hypothetical protein
MSIKNRAMKEMLAKPGLAACPWYVRCWRSILYVLMWRDAA